VKRAREIKDRRAHVREKIERFNTQAMQQANNTRKRSIVSRGTWYGST